MKSAAVSGDPIRTHVIHGKHSSGWQLGPHEQAFLEVNLQPTMRTIETGAGASTVVFARKGTTHVCITPSDDEVKQIRVHCQEKRVSLENVTFMIGPSEDILPNLDEREFDLALLDGRHGFPAPFMDWFFIAERLKQGGLIIIDDLHIWAPELLKQFLLEEPAWELVRDNNRAAIFKMLKEGSTRREWIHQRYVLRHSRNRSWRYKMLNLFNLIRRGEFGIIWQALVMMKRKALRARRR